MKKVKSKQSKKVSKMMKEQNLLQEQIVVKNAEGDSDTTATIIHRAKISYTPKVSVIIPVYNVEEYLRECLDSVINQTLKEIEIICVDDGSTDNSLNILKEYANKDNRITLITQENYGSGKARNNGINLAKGTFVAFMDSDDEYPTSYVLEKMYSKAIENNVLICGGSLNQLINGVKVTDSSKFEQGYSFEKEGVVKYKDYQFDYGYWRFIYQREFLVQNQLYFPDYLRQQDPPFFIKTMAMAEKFYALKEATYVYRVSHKQITWTERKVVDMFKGLEDCLVMSKTYNLSDLHIKIAQRINAWTFRTAIAATIKYSSVKKQLNKTLCSIDQELLNKNNINLEFDTIYNVANLERNNLPIVSVIVPVYNVEKYLSRCLDSVISQTFKSIEVLCINDGSTDNSLKILKEYEKKDKRIKIINKENGGLSSARNCGLKNAQGYFIYFIDSDDWIDETTLEKAVAKMSGEIDIVSWGASLINDGLDENNRGLIVGREYHKIKIAGQRKITDEIILASTFTVWNKLFKSEILRKYNLKFCEGRLFEDNDFTINYMLHCRQAFYIDEYLYNYVQRPNSIMERVRACECDRTVDNFYIFDNIYQHIKQYDNLSQHIRLLTSRYLIHLRSAYKFAPSNMKEFICKEATIFARKYDSKYFNTASVKYVQNAEYNKVRELNEIIISLTSYPARIETVNQTIESLLNQSMKADKVILWLAPEQFPNKEQDLPQQLLALKDKGLTIDWYHDIRSYKKLIPTLKLYPDAIIVTADDDLLYDKYWLKILYDSYLKDPKCIHVHRITRLYLLDNKLRIIPRNLYLDNQDNYLADIKQASCFNKLSSGAGTLFPPHCFADEICNEELFMTLAPTSDDIWFWLMGVKNNYRVKVADKNIYKLKYIPNTQEEALCKINDVANFKVFYSHLNNIVDCFNLLDVMKSDHNDNYVLCKKLFGTHSYKYKKELTEWWYRVKRKPLNLNNPKTFNEKIQWLKLYDSTPIKTKLADKYLVRDWIKKKIGEEYLIPLLGVYDRFEDIDFDKLPNRFVIKCNHGSGYNIIVKDKSELDLVDVKNKLDKWMSENFAFRVGCELHYRDITPKIIIEQYMEDESGDLRDYKYTCFDGKPEFIWIDSDRYTEHKRNLYDLDWKQLPYQVNSRYKTFTSPEKPFCLEKMTELASILSEGFSYVRVDFYIINNKIYFGEMTFTSSSGTEDIKPESFDKHLASKIKLPKFAYNIDTGEYYKLPKQSKAKPYLLFPYYAMALPILRKRYGKKIINDIKQQLSLSRIDIKNFGNVDNDVDITSPTAKISAPEWFKNNQGMGKVISSSQMKNKLQIKAIKDGKLVFNFKGEDRRFNNVRFPVWIDYKSIKIDGKEILSMPISVWHDKPFCYEMLVRNGQVITVEYEQQPHYYSKQELKDIVLKLNPNSEYVQNNIKSIVNNIYVNIDYKAEELKNIPLIMADYFIPLGAACRPAYWLKKNDIRKCSLPFDWMMNYSFDIVIKAVKFGINNWFSNYSEKETKLRFRHVTDTNNKMISMHAFPVSTDVSNYMNTFKEIFNRRYLRFINILNSKKSVCFICNRSENINELICFIKLMKSLYSQTSFTLINVRHTERDENITCYKLSKNLIIYEINAYDFHMNGNDKEKNPSFWIGNETLWNKICSKLIVKEAKPSKLFSIQKKDSRKIIRFLGIKLTLRNKRKELLNLLQQNRNELITRFDDLTNKHKQLEVKYNTQQQQHQKTIELLNNLQEQLVNMNDKNTENSKIISNNIISNSVSLQNDISNIFRTITETNDDVLNNINASNSDLIQNAKNNTAQIISEIMNSSEIIKQQILEASLDSKSCVENSLNSLQSEFKQTAESNKSQIVAKIDEVGNEVKLLNNMDLEKLIQKLSNDNLSSYNAIKNDVADFVAKHQQIESFAQELLIKLEKKQIADTDNNLEVQNQIKLLRVDANSSAAEIKNKIDEKLKSLMFSVEREQVLYYNPFETETRLERGMCDIVQTPNFEQRLLSLVSGLDDDSVTTVIKIINRLQQIKGTNRKLDLFSPEEKIQLRELKSYYQSILKISDNLYCYKNYLLPIRHFESSVFLYRHGLDRLTNLETIKDKAILDVGAFIGDSALILSPLTNDKVYSFEATTENYNHLLKTIELNKLKNIVPIKSAVGADNTTIEIRCGGSCSSSSDLMVKSPTHIEKCQVIRIDDYVKEHNLKVGLIKVDIEGAEQEFLKGAIQTIKEQKPTMLISIYHNVDDFLDIKPMIESWNLGYKFSIFKPTIESVSSETLLICEQ